MLQTSYETARTKPAIESIGSATIMASPVFLRAPQRRDERGVASPTITAGKETAASQARRLAGWNCTSEDAEASSLE
jgi:hypothetical protein